MRINDIGASQENLLWDRKLAFLPFLDNSLVPNVEMASEELNPWFSARKRLFKGLKRRSKR
jgi:hypothetical protein